MEKKDKEELNISLKCNDEALKLNASQQLNFWNAIHTTVELSEKQKELSLIILGNKSI